MSPFWKMGKAYRQFFFKNFIIIFLFKPGCTLKNGTFQPRQLACRTVINRHIEHNSFTVFKSTQRNPAPSRLTQTKRAGSREEWGAKTKTNLQMLKISPDMSLGVKCHLHKRSLGGVSPKKWQMFHIRAFLAQNTPIHLFTQTHRKSASPQQFKCANRISHKTKLLLFP